MPGAILALLIAVPDKATRGSVRETDVREELEVGPFGRFGGTEPPRAARPTAEAGAGAGAAAVVVLAARENFVGIVDKFGTPARLRFFRISFISQAERLRRNLLRFGIVSVGFAGSGDTARAPCRANACGKFCNSLESGGTV